jgi:hypothetical protein
MDAGSSEKGGYPVSKVPNQFEKKKPPEIQIISVTTINEQSLNISKHFIKISSDKNST